MPKSKSRKKDNHKKKRRLVLEMWPGKPVKRVSPAFSTKEHVWHGEVMSELPCGRVEEFTIRPDYPMPLTDYLDVLQSELRKLVPDGSTECGVRIFARV